MDFALIETLRREPGEGFIRGDLHLDRMEASAAALGFAFDRARVLFEMEKVAAGETPLRVRLELARNGNVTVVATPFDRLPANTVWRIAIAATRLDSRDALLRHKTTRRGTYFAARAEFSGAEADEVILLNEDGAACEGTITNIFARFEPNGTLLTPPISCGLLPGVLRMTLLESGAAREATLTPGDLAGVSELFCGNSLRGLIPAALI
jgi:4-amino-4-deoxychorismate lyase